MPGKRGKNWTQEELDYLTDNWGSVSITTLSKNLGRSVDAIMHKRHKLRLGPFIEASEMVSFSQVVKALCGREGSSGWANYSWCKNRGFPLHKVRISKKKFCRMVRLSELWEWLWEKRSFLDFSGFEKGMLGKEPAWVDEKRRADVKLREGREKFAAWTPEEDALLKHLCGMQKYDCREICRRFRGRTEGSVRRRVTILGMQDKLRRIRSHDIRWNAAAKEQLKKLIAAGKKYTEMSSIMDRSEKSIRACVGRIYGTESLEKVWAMM